MIGRHPYAAAVELIAASADREHAEWADGYRAGVEAGIDIGYVRAHAEIEAQQGRLHRELVDGVRVLDEIERARREPSRTGYCRHQGCREIVSVPYGTRYDLIICRAHMPRRPCAEHRDTDVCAYVAHQKRTHEPEYTGGPASLDAWEQWAQAKQAGRGAVA